ncbi:pilus assembly protein PilZ [Legionella antarctica]|uniref:Pilus assembly protein PilZ n=1 Tax=Legionella antarctica TaxID=2708020 RepID=A0A6F8T605_9GAMM|nr:PilZ domain-containing protein [Legionella antarctica]BCA95643.1 pilus assembly protein PilZ [Legionella antarctica]
MSINEKRQYFRIDDNLYFDYAIIEPGQFCSDLSIINQLSSDKNQKKLEAAQYFQNIDYEMSELTHAIRVNEPGWAHYFNLLNAKIDCLSQMLVLSKIQMHSVNISLSGMTFKTNDQIKEKTNLKIVIYTKPKMTPIIVDAQVVYSQYQTETHYRTAVSFNGLTYSQEQLLSQHILQAQVKNRSN